ncbi:MAG TPA: AAC(3) family N-acetyltransferase [Planctomycetota bacterium]|nr:AAC(3) family N-acetyltransferase [Planctomycetota bacterium]
MAVTKDDIKTGLAELGLKEGDAVLVHSDLRMLGLARELVKLPNCGADMVIDAFLETVGPDGLVAVPALTATFAPSMPDGPVGLVFDPDTTPSRVGSVTNVFLARPERKRSRHPTHSLAAIGARAEEYVADHEKGSTFDRASPYGKNFDWDAWICFFGTGNRTNTTLHVVEDWMGLPYMAVSRALVKGPDGQPLEVEVTKSPKGYRNFYKKNSRAAKVLDGAGIMRRAKIGEAEIGLMRCRDCMRLFWDRMLDDPCLLLGSKGENPFCDAWADKTIAHVKSGGAGPRP